MDIGYDHNPTTRAALAGIVNSTSAFLSYRDERRGRNKAEPREERMAASLNSWVNVLLDNSIQSGGLQLWGQRLHTNDGVAMLVSQPQAGECSGLLHLYVANIGFMRQ